MKSRGFYVAATGQNVGKTTTCLGLFFGLRKRYKTVGYIKPVGQEHVETEDKSRVDKDVLLFRSHFKLDDPYEEMSPVLLPRGFTRDYLDGKVNHDELSQKIVQAHKSITSRYPITVIEGTGHTAVGSIVDLNNAQVASLLKIPIILVASGGLGSSFDELELNIAQCEKHNVRVAGVILNRVLDEKRDMIVNYMGKALTKRNIPILGVIPYASFLSTPTMRDFEQVFKTTLLSGEEHRWRHFRHIGLVASTVEVYRTVIISNQLVITPADREDIILATLTRFWDMKISDPDTDLDAGMILTGKTPPKKSIVDQIRKAGIPMLYSPVSSFVAMKMIHSHTAKIQSEDSSKIEAAVGVVESNIYFDLLEKSLIETII
jgi:phosphate acetyltransferase